MNNCKICNSELTNIEKVLRARMRDLNGKKVADRIIYKSWCPNCEIYLNKSTQGKQDSGWKTSHIQHNELKHELSENEIFKLKIEIEQTSKKDDIFKTEERWKEFISMKKETDKIYNYVQIDSSHQILGYVIKRDSFLIGSFVHKIENKVI